MAAGDNPEVFNLGLPMDPDQADRILDRVDEVLSVIDGIELEPVLSPGFVMAGHQEMVRRLGLDGELEPDYARRAAQDICRSRPGLAGLLLPITVDVVGLSIVSSPERGPNQSNPRVLLELGGAACAKAIADRSFLRQGLRLPKRGVPARIRMGRLVGDISDSIEDLTFRSGLPKTISLEPIDILPVIEGESRMS